MTERNDPFSAETLEVAVQRPDGSWSDESLVRDFLDRQNQSPGSSWYLARWTAQEPRTGGLLITLNCSARESDPGNVRAVVEELRLKLAHSLSLLTQEKGWPLPRFHIVSGSEHLQEGWSYAFRLGPYRTEPVVIYPNKILAVGDEDALSPLLGLECVDPVFGLPAKWVTFSQSERAVQQGSLLFESTQVVIGHAMDYLQSRMHHAVGLWELNSWIVEALPGQDRAAVERLAELLPLLLKLIKEYLAEGLHLPDPSRFWEHVQVARASARDLPEEELSLLLRRDVVAHNIPRWLDASGTLQVIEWKGPAEPATDDHHRMLRRLSGILEEASGGSGGTPLLLAEAGGRRELAGALRGLFPDLPVLAWSDLSDLSNLNIVATIDAALKVDPPPTPAAFFTAESFLSAVSAEEQALG